jgi:transcriptional regulator with XRE-family HTH domain
MQQAYAIDPMVLFEHSEPVAQNRFLLGAEIRRVRKAQGLSQDALALKSGTSKAYISRLENNMIEPELHTLYKIVEIGLSKKISLTIQ